MRGSRLIEDLVRDLRFAMGQLWTSPGFTGTVVFTLALGMCASVAIFAFADAALLKPLPYRDPGILVGVFESIAIFPQSNLSYLDYLDWKRMNTVFSRLDVYQRNDAILATHEGPQLAFYGRVSDGFFRTLGVAPLLGRDFYPGEDLPDAPRTILFTDHRKDELIDAAGAATLTFFQGHVVYQQWLPERTYP